MFIDSEKLVTIKVYYKKVGREYIAHSEKEFVKLKIDEPTRQSFKSLELKMKQLTWGLHNDIQDESYIYLDGPNGPQTVRKFSYKLYKLNRMIKLIAEWDAKMPNSKGDLVSVPLTEEHILKIAPNIAESILEAYDECMMLSDEEEKK